METLAESNWTQKLPFFIKYTPDISNKDFGKLISQCLLWCRSSMVIYKTDCVIKLRTAVEEAELDKWIHDNKLINEITYYRGKGIGVKNLTNDYEDLL